MVTMGADYYSYSEDKVCSTSLKIYQSYYFKKLKKINALIIVFYV